MSLDASIPLGFQPQRINTPFENLNIVLDTKRKEQQVRAQDLELKQQEKTAQDQARVQEVFQQYGNDPERMFAEIGKFNPSLAMKMRGEAQDYAIKGLELKAKQTALEHAKTDYLLTELISLPPGDDAAYQQWRSKAAKEGLEGAPPQRTKETEPAIQQFAMRGEKARQVLKDQWDKINSDTDNAREQARLDAEIARNKAMDERNARKDEEALANTKADNARADESLRISREHLRLSQQAAARQSAATGTTSIPPEYATLLDRAMWKATPKQKETAIALADRLAKSGDTEQLKNVIKQIAVEGENVAIKNQVQGRMTALASLRDIRTMLQELKQSGVDTNVLRGSVEDAARKLGTSTNPKLAELGTRIQASYMDYRRAMSGAQFSIPESQEYARVYPNYSNTLPLNEAILAGMERAMGTQDRVFWTSKFDQKGAELLGALTAPTTGAAPSKPSTGSLYDRYKQRKQGGG